MPETPSDSIWIVTEDTPQISIPEGTRGGISRGGNWGDETRETTGTKAPGDAVKVSAQKFSNAKQQNEIAIALFKIFR